MIAAALKNPIISVAKQNEDLFVAHTTIRCDSVGIRQKRGGPGGGCFFQSFMLPDCSFPLVTVPPPGTPNLPLD